MRKFISCPRCKRKSCDVLRDYGYCTKCEYNSIQHGMPPISRIHQVTNRNGQKVTINLERIREIQDRLNSNKKQKESP
ncbi:MAG: hypothetical protein OXB88_04170 [Bacteriovoracales bacterium]|nr:hypothetical protein [Bacteriovoracales bacterium]